MPLAKKSRRADIKHSRRHKDVDLPVWIDNTELRIVANYRLRGGVSFLIIAIAN
jgi:hypothetical protein